ncbi:MAG TPA: sialidase family protein [Terriglobia bacterium]|nr:sialidase family protein [Terriglobia bacterium]
MALVTHGNPDAPYFRSELIFEPGSVAGYPSCHASTLVELPDGELQAAWFAGSEEGAGDVAELSSRLAPGSTAWSKPQVAVDTPGKADGNPVLHVDRHGRVWMFYVTKENDRRPQWAQCPIMCRVSTDGGRTFGPQRIIHAELGWMDRNKPIYLSNGDLLLPLYDERNWTSLVFISPNDGATWSASQVIAGKGGNIQPTLAQLSDGSVLALMRTGSNHHRLWKAVSRDNGRTWSSPQETDLPNPNSACDMVRLADGHLVLAFNNSTTGRTPLTVALSTDEGRSWPSKRNLETAPGEFSYPAVIQTRDGLIHVTYTYQRRSIKHVVLNEAWLASAR